VDFSQGKLISYMQIRGDFLNGLNKSIRATPTTSIDKANFGLIRSVRGMRVIQLSGRLSW